MSISNAIIEDLKAKLADLPISQEERDRIVKSAKTPTHIYPKQIVFNEDNLTLRKPDETSKKFKEMVESIKTPRKNAIGEVTIDHGLILPIAVREVGSRPGIYALVDGGHRLTCWKAAFGDSKPIPATILDLDDEATMVAQVEANIHSVKQQRAEVGKHMRKLLNFHDNWTVVDLSRVFNLSTPAVGDYLSLTTLPDDIQERVNKDEKDPNALPATVGYALAKFSPPKKCTPEQKAEYLDAQRQWLNRWDELKTEPQGFNRFMGESNNAYKNLKKGDRKPKGESFTPGEVILFPTVRKKGVLETEMDRARNTVKDDFPDKVKNSAKEFAEEYPEEAKYLRAATWRDCLEYVLQVDEATKVVREAEEIKRAETRKESSDKKKAGDKSESVARMTSFSNLWK